ncbi:MAG: ABC transporter permease [Candidatus Dormiibacterota bacterium]
MSDASLQESGGWRGSVTAARELLGRSGIVSPLIGLLLACVVFTLLSANFLSFANFSQILQQVMEVGTLAVGQTLIILVAGIDLANGLVMVLGTIVMARLATEGVPVPLAILVGVAITLLCGALEGGLVTWIRLPPFIITLGLYNIAMAVALLYSHQSAITNLPGGLLVLGNRFPLLGTTWSVGTLVMLAIFAVVWYALTQTGWGRHLYAVGDNVEAARLTGINVTRVLFSAYMLAGLIYGITSLIVLGRTAVGDPNAGATDNLDSITAVVIGGTSLFGGRGSVVGTLIGAVFVGVLRNGLTLVGVDALYQDIATGVLVILAVGVDRFTRRRA